MQNIKVVHNPNEQTLDQLGVKGWGIWTKEVSTFPWTYDSTETCYLLEGEVTVTPNGGAPVHIEKGDLVTFPKGMACTWDVTRPVRKHYTFED